MNGCQTMLEIVSNSDIVKQSDCCWVILHTPEGYARVHVMKSTPKVAMEMYNAAGLCFKFAMQFSEVDGVGSKD